MASSLNVSKAHQQDDDSEYGSDFTADEEEILNGILSQLPQSQAASTVVEDRVIPSIEDNEASSTTRTARVLGRPQWIQTDDSDSMRTSADRETPRITVEVEKVESRDAPNGKYSSLQPPFPIMTD
jgi:hypothetical protein